MAGVTLSEKKITLVFAGDLSFAGAVQHFANKKNGCDYKRPFDKIRSYFQDADFSMVNLESPFSNQGTQEQSFMPGKYVLHYGEPRAIEGLKYLGVSAVYLANNHLADFGKPSIALTLKLLESANISHAGITFGKDTHLPQKPLVVTIKGIKVAFLAYCYVDQGCIRTRNLLDTGPAVYSRTTAMKDIDYALNKVKADHVIVYFHWGTEYLDVPSEKRRAEFQIIIDSGASLVICSHSHIREVHEVYDGKLIQYGLGNFLFGAHTSLGRRFLASEEEKPSAEKDYLERASLDWDRSAYGFLLKVVLNRKKIISFSILNLRIRQNGLCLQPTPGKQGWIKVCSPEDQFCPNLSEMFLPYHLSVYRNTLLA